PVYSARVFPGALILLLPLLLACEPARPASHALQTFPTPFSTEEAPRTGESALAPLPEHIELDERKVALGARLFRDLRLSFDGKVACNDCHALDRGGAAGERRSTLPGRKPVAVNVPSVFNAAFFFRFGWSGRFEDIGQQLDVAMNAPAVMANTWERAA